MHMASLSPLLAAMDRWISSATGASRGSSAPYARHAHVSHLEASGTDIGFHAPELGLRGTTGRFSQLLCPFAIKLQRQLPRRLMPLIKRGASKKNLG